MLDRIVEALENDIGRAFRRARRTAERPDRQQPRLRRAPDQPRMRHDRAGDAGAVDMRTFLAAERVETVGDRIGEFRMLDVDT